MFTYSVGSAQLREHSGFVGLHVTAAPAKEDEEDVLRITFPTQMTTADLAPSDMYDNYDENADENADE